MSDIADAYEASYTIMLNLNRSWITKQGDFFVESPIILLAAIIWYLRIYQGGKYCTFPHAIELLNKKYADVFTILRSYPELENYLVPWMHITLIKTDPSRKIIEIETSMGITFSIVSRARLDALCALLQLERVKMIRPAEGVRVKANLQTEGDE